MEDRYLFKAKRLDNGEWVVGNLITNVFFRLGQSIPYILCPDKADYYCFEDFSEENGIFEVQPDTICQCTELKDDNDTLIFENDVLSLTDKVSDYEWKAVVKFGNPDSNDTWGWRLVPITECYVNREILLWVETELNTVECRVIGNIFDNKELLESEEKQ